MTVALRSRVIGETVRIDLTQRGRRGQVIVYFASGENPHEVVYSFDHIDRGKGNRRIAGGTFTLWKPPRNRKKRARH